jgi:DNA ligase, NAD-dependent
MFYNDTIKMNEKIKQEYEELVKVIEYHNNLYYNEDDPEITDYEYDQLTQKLKKMEKEYPSLVTKSSPTQKITGKVKRELGISVEHKIPMLSLSDVFSKDEVIDFVESVKKDYPEASFVVEQKIDGLSLSIQYENGILTCGSTRGNGHVGEDVTLNVKELKNVPEKVDNIPLLEVRGECYMSGENFLLANEKQDEIGGKLFKNARNCAAGTLRQLDPKVVKERGLDVIIFNLQRISGKEILTHSQSLEYLRSLGFQVSPNYHICNTSDEVLEAIDDIGNNRNGLPYGIDGAVVKVDSLNLREEMGNTSKVPRWAIAYKYPPEQKETIVKDIVVQVGRTGRLTPVAEVETVDLAGSSVSRATLHNQDQIDRLDIGIGDTVIIQKAGDIIPEIVKVVKEKRQEGTTRFKLPDRCPVCNSLIVEDERCTNPDCQAQLIRNIQFFVSKDCMDISGMGPSIVEKLMESDYLHHVADIYKLKDYRDELIEKNIIGKTKTVDNLLKAIEKSKEQDIDRLVKALGALNVGKHAGKILSEKYGTMDAIMDAKYEDLVELQDIGDITAKSITDFFSRIEIRNIVKELKEAGVNMTSKASEKKQSSKFEGKTFVITGTLPSMGRTEMADLITSNGGKVSGSVSKKTSYLVAGESAGSKLTKANELGITVISEEDVKNMLQ